MTTVCNSTPIISLSSVGHFDILQQLFGEVIIAEAVYQEIKAKQSHGYREIDAPFINVMPIQGRVYCDLLLKDLDKGEAETIILAKELNATRVLIDENLGYKLAKNAGLNVVRTLSILLKAKEAGLIPALKPILDEMVGKGRWYSHSVYQAILERAGEI
jgi:predicted nucleic acid-binding protein